METLGGVSIGLVIFYAGWSTISAGKTPGEFMSFITALLLAYEPAKRLARIQVGLAESLVAGPRALLRSSIIRRASPRLDDKPALKLTRGDIELEDVDFRLPRQRAGGEGRDRSRSSMASASRSSVRRAAASRRSCR